MDILEEEESGLSEGSEDEAEEPSRLEDDIELGLPGPSHRGQLEGHEESLDEVVEDAASIATGISLIKCPESHPGSSFTVDSTSRNHSSYTPRGSKDLSGEDIHTDEDDSASTAFRESVINVDDNLLPAPVLFAETNHSENGSARKTSSSSVVETSETVPSVEGRHRLNGAGQNNKSVAESHEDGTRDITISNIVADERIMDAQSAESVDDWLVLPNTDTVKRASKITQAPYSINSEMDSSRSHSPTQVVASEASQTVLKMPESGSEHERPLHRNSSFPEPPPPLPPQGPPPTPPLPPPPPPAPLATCETDSQSANEQRMTNQREGNGTLLRKGSCDGGLPCYESKSPLSTLSRSRQPRRKGDAVHTLSNLYTKLLLSSTFILLLTELLPNQLPLFFFHSYLYAYILGGAVVFLTSIYISVIMSKCPEFGPPDDAEYGCGPKRKGKPASVVSIYVRLGSILFALGTLVATSLEVATLFTMNEPCLSDLSLSLPVMQVVFTFLQLHFLVMNGQKVLGTMGWFRHISLMHLTAANIAIWLKMVLWDTTYEWLVSNHVTPTEEKLWPPAGYNTTVHVLEMSGEHKVYYSINCRPWKIHQNEKTEDLIALHQCLYNNTVGAIWKKSVPFISPFVLQYSLLAAFITYSLWVCLQHPSRTRKRISSNSSLEIGSSNEDEPPRCHLNWRVDCQGSSKGFFLGILVLAAGIIALILHFVLTNDRNLRSVTLLALVATHSGIQGISALASMLGLCQIQDLKIRVSRPRYSDELIQGVGVMAAFIYGCFAMVAAVIDLNDTYHLVVFVDGGLLLLQSIVQSLLIRQVAQRSANGDPDSRRSRSGRQVVTFLIFTNIVLWLMETFTTHDHVTSQLQLHFFGTIPWGLVGRVIFPMVMLYRFHSAMALLDGWKRAYKTKARV